MYAKIRLPILCCQVPRFILDFHLYSVLADWALPHDVVLLLEQKLISSSPLEFGLRRWPSLLLDAVLLHETGAGTV